MNWLAVVVGTLAYYLLAPLWFAEFAFYPVWRRSLGWEKETLPTSYYVIPLITCLTTVVVIALLAEATTTDSLGEGALLGILVGVGVVAAALLNTGGLDPKKPHPLVWFLVTAGYHVLGVVIAASIVASWS